MAEPEVRTYRTKRKYDIKYVQDGTFMYHERWRTNLGALDVSRHDT